MPINNCGGDRHFSWKKFLWEWLKIPEGEDDDEEEDAENSWKNPCWEWLKYPGG